MSPEGACRFRQVVNLQSGRIGCLVKGAWAPAAAATDGVQSSGSSSSTCRRMCQSGTVNTDLDPVQQISKAS
jgi:hypothetical protein